MQRNALEGRPVQGIGDSWVRSLSPPPSSLPELRKPSPIRNRPFLRGFLAPIFEFPVSADNNRRSGGFLASGDLLNVGHGARHDLVKPATTAGDCVDQACTALDPRRANFIFGNAVRDKDLPGLPGRQLLPRN